MTSALAAPDARVRRRLVVRGRVQGVAFRASTQAQAARLGLAGWVRNRADGSVEVEAEGPLPAVDALIAFCRRGPRFAQVSDLAATPLEPEGGVEFTIR